MAYQYDKLNRLSTVTAPGQSPTLYGYDAVGNLAGYTYPNGVSTTLQYDGLNRLTNLASQGAVASYQYTLGAAGNQTGVTELSGRAVAYQYDNLYRLISETRLLPVVSPTRMTSRTISCGTAESATSTTEMATGCRRPSEA